MENLMSKTEIEPAKTGWGAAESTFSMNAVAFNITIEQLTFLTHDFIEDLKTFLHFTRPFIMTHLRKW